MRNSSKLLALGLVLFLGACSAAEGDFLKKVEGKTAYADKDYASKIGAFSSDGKKFTPEGSVGQAVTFSKATDENTADYTVTISGTEYVYTITTTDGKTGSVKNAAGSIPAWLK